MDRRRSTTPTQGAQFTAAAFTDVLKAHQVQISMDGQGRWVDNVFVERIWRSVKHEDIHLKAYETPTGLRAGLDRQTPDEVYFGTMSSLPRAA